MRKPKVKIITVGSMVDVELNRGFATGGRERVTKIDKRFVYCGRDKFWRGNGWHAGGKGYFIYQIAVCRVPRYKVKAT